MIAHVGPLTMAVNALGSYAAGTKRWRVGEIFGQWQHSGRHEDVNDAIAVAEQIAVRLLEEAHGAVQRATAPTEVAAAPIDHLREAGR